MNAPSPLRIINGSAAAEEFRWPAPPYFEFGCEQDRVDWADCMLTFRDGAKLNGQLRRFVPGEAWLSFRPEAASAAVSVAFSALLKLQLHRPVELKRETAPAAPTEPETLLPSESQQFRIDLTSGEIFRGITLGYVSALCGLFLYLPQANGRVVRCFVPAGAAKICDIDAPIGQILINQKAASPEAVGAALNLQATMRTQRFDQFLTQSTGAAETSGTGRASAPRQSHVPPEREAQGARAGAARTAHEHAVLDKLRAMTLVKAVALPTASANAGARGKAGDASATQFAVQPRKTDARIKRETSETRLARVTARNPTGVQELVLRLASESGNQDITEQHAAKSDSALVALVNTIILDAVQQRASDIHLEANLGPKPTRVRFRKDGALVNYLELPAQFRNAVVSRIKIMSQLDITERRKPQDGKIDFSRFGPAQVELRVATVPTTGGLEDVVMRVLAACSPVPVGELGLDPDSLESVKRLISKPHGLFLVCGPTGSGKTTTLHSLLAHLNTSEQKIWTAEDPIEITQPGLRQVQVNAKIGWTFAAAMRSFMRADPDVIMVGEMRDAETAKIGIEASLTGHLLLSTLHTNSGPESIVRLLDLGMDPFNFADALLGVLAQRLAKRLCPECRIGYLAQPAELELLSAEYCNGTAIDAHRQIRNWIARHGDAHGRITLYRAHGCAHCDNAGYYGRIGVHELLVADPATKRLIQARAPVADVKGAAIAAGMRTLRQDGIEKILQGLTDLRQVNTICN